MSRFLLEPGGHLVGEASVPGDKSISHRAVILGAVADGRTRVSGFLEGADTLHTARIFARLGVPMARDDSGALLLDGVGLQGLRAADGPLDCGNAGTAMRLLAGLLAGQRFASTLVGDDSLSRRPMRRVLAPLARMGAMITASPTDTAPLRIAPSPGLRGILHRSEVASAQVKSAVLLAGLYAEGRTRVEEPQPTRDYTERMLKAFGADLRFGPGWAELMPGRSLLAQEVMVPGDFSSAAFLLVGAAIAPGSRVRLGGVGIHPRRTGLLDCLREMGARITVQAVADQAGEAVADLEVHGDGLRGIDVPVDRVGDMIDEFPALLVAAALAEGTTRVRGAGELRVKESDRLAAMAAGLSALGVPVVEYPDGIDVVGVGSLRPPPGTVLDSQTDHRIAMALAVAALRAEGAYAIDRVDNVATSFPGFAELLARLGLAIRVQ